MVQKWILPLAFVLWIVSRGLGIHILLAGWVIIILVLTGVMWLIGKGIDLIKIKYNNKRSQPTNIR